MFPFRKKKKGGARRPGKALPAKGGRSKTAVKKAPLLLTSAAVSSTVNKTRSRNKEQKDFSARQLPVTYGDHFIFLMVRDPYWIYAYWEMQKECQEAALNQLGGDWNTVKSILRIYDTSGKNNRPVFFDIDLSGLARTWYIEGQPNHSYVIEIGLLHNDGRFLPLARSNEVTTPRAWMSEIIDEQWMGIDFDKMYALSGGFEVGKSSQELKRLMEERLFKSISSGSGSGASPARK